MLTLLLPGQECSCSTSVSNWQLVGTLLTLDGLSRVPVLR